MPTFFALYNRAPTNDKPVDETKFDGTGDETSSDGGSEEKENEYVEYNIVAKIPTQEKIDRFEQTVYDKTEKKRVHILYDNR